MLPEFSFCPGPELLSALPGRSETLSSEAGSLFRAHRMTSDGKPNYKMLCISDVLFEDRMEAAVPPPSVPPRCVNYGPRGREHLRALALT